MAGSFIHTLVGTDVGSGWTEFVPLLARGQSLVIEGPEGPFNGFSTFSADIAMERCEVAPAPGAILQGAIGTGLAG